MEKLPAKETKPRKIEDERIKTLVRPLIKIAEQIKQDVDAGKYAMIIGDDASGRLPALALSRAINEVNEAVGRAKADVRFVALYSRFKNQAAWETIIPAQEYGDNTWGKRARAIAKAKVKTEFVDKLDAESLKDKKILLVTEISATGSALSYLLQALKEANISVDVAIADKLSEDIDVASKLKEYGAENVYHGDGDVRIYEAYDIAGVRKDQEVFQTRALPCKERGDKPSEPTEEQLAAQEVINEARKDIKRVGDIVFQKVWGRDAKRQ